MSDLSDSFLSGGNIEFIEALYARYLEDPASVDPSWRSLFDQSGRDGKPIYSLPTDGNGNYQPGGTVVYDAGRDIKTNVVSRWSAMITLRYTF